MKKLRISKSDLESLNNTELAKIEDEIEMREGLPHLFGYKWYPWQKEFFDSVNRDNFICAANQIGKSTIQICKAIYWATEPDIWKDLWISRPTQFWYFYPSLKLATNEYKEKWVKEILPRNGYENDPQYGWKADIKSRTIQSIEFNTGVTIYFCSYSQNETDLQAGTVYSMFCDEELPEYLWPELQARLRATRGYYHQVFTATLGQEIWRATIEETGKLEKFPNAFKKQITMYDCQEYIDGSKSQWSDKRIKEEIQRCLTQTEVDRRIFGKFVVEGGLRYPSFDRKENVKEGHDLPKGWHVYGAADIGSGGKHGHPAAIVFVAVSPDFKQGRVFKCWRGDHITTTATDILDKFVELRGNLKCMNQWYDWASADFGTIAQRIGEPFQKAEKGKELGEGVLNTLFRNNMLYIYDSDEGRKLISELSYLKIDINKINAKDDLCDALRYCCAGIPWDFSAIKRGPRKPGNQKKVYEINEREQFRKRQLMGVPEKQDIDEQMDYITEEINEWNEYY